MVPAGIVSHWHANTMIRNRCIENSFYYLLILVFLRHQLSLPFQSIMTRPRLFSVYFDESFEVRLVYICPEILMEVHTFIFTVLIHTIAQFMML
jgi:hypothetical protein